MLLSRDHLVGLLDREAPHALAGRPSADMPDPGPTICACLNVGLNTIRRALVGGGLNSVAAIGQALGAGSNCGSCRPELAALLARAQMPAAAEWRGGSTEV